MPSPPALNIDQLHFQWPQSSDSRNDWSMHIDALSIAAGERVFLFGPSGSGKSTLLGLIAGVLDPASGHIEIHGQAISGLKAHQRDQFRANHLGMIFQLFNLVPYLSVIENVLLPCRFSQARRQRVDGPPEREAHRLLDHLDLHASERAKPVSELSIGQQQRVAAARALIGRPSLIIADEPTSALDADRQESFLELLSSECAASGASLLFVSHDQRLAERFDQRINLLDIAGKPIETAHQ
ncbi:MAG: ABC transporter ATP-binding protein [Gammaproteobacteria bacterium]